MAMGVETYYAVFSARAGMIRHLSSCDDAPRCIPRESGDDPSSIWDPWADSEYSPRERG